MDAETKTITGTCAEISERGEWTTFHVDIGTQYPVKLSTKLAPLIELGRTASKDGGVFDWTFKESQGAENPHKPGTFYTNRYLSAVEPAGTASTPAAAPSSDGVRTYTPDLKDRMIVRQTALKAAAEIMAASPSAHPDYDPALEVMKAAARFETWVYRDIDPVPFDGPELSEHDQEIPY